jgi:membrane protein
VATAVSEEITGPGAWDHLKRAFSTYRSHQMTDRAASLTYFGMLSLFPGALMVISLLTLVGQQDLAPRAANYLLERGADRTTAEAVRGALDSMVRTSGGAAGLTLVISLGLALNGASASFGAAGRALNVVHGIDDGRGFVHRKLVDLAWTLIVVFLILFTLVAILLGGTIADDALRALGLGDAGAGIWRWARWPAGLAAIIVAFALVYAFAPDVEPRRLRWITPGSVFAVVAWALASLGFSVYISNFSSYGAAYGAFGAAIVLLLWIYLACNAFLFGAELNMAIERSRGAGRGGPPFVTPPPGSPTASARRGADAR